MFRKINANKIIFGLLALYALLIIWYGWTQYPIGKTRSVENDFFAWYANNAEQVINDGIFSLKNYDFNPPLYSLFLALTGSVTENLFSAGKMISVISSIVTLCCIFFLIRKMFDPALAVLVVLVTAMNSYFLLHSYYVGTDMMFMALAYIGITLLITQKHNYKVLILLGHVAGLAYLTRYNGIFLILIFVLTLSFSAFQSSQAVSKIWKGLCCFLSFLITILPWHLFLLIREGEFFYNKNHLNMARDFLHLDENKDFFWGAMASDYKSIIDVILFDPGKFFENIFSNPQNHLANHFHHLIPEHLGVFVILGTVFLVFELASSKEKRRLKGVFLFSIIGYFFLMCLIKFEPRYFLYMVPFYSLALIYAPYQILRRIPKKYFKETTKIAMMFVLVLYVSWRGILFQGAYANSFNTEIPEIGNFMSFFVNRNDQIMARSANIAYFSGANYDTFPFGIIDNEKEFVQEARSSEADFVFFSAVERPVRLAFEGSFFNGTSIPSWQKILVWKRQPREGLIYRLVKEGEASGWMVYSRINFETITVWQEFFEKVSNPDKKLVVLEGLINITQPGAYSLAFSGDEFKIFIDDDLVMNNANRYASFSIKSHNFKEGFHLIRIEFEASPKSVVPPGLFWETPLGKKEPIPRKNLIITKVDFVFKTHGS